MAQDSRTQVKTYVPEYQKREWQQHADRLGMSQSEFVRTMVQAGRRGFGDSIETDDSGPGSESTVEQSVDDEDLESGVVEALASEGPLSWDALLAEITDDVERRLDETLERLQRAGRVRYSGREDGYVLIEQ